MHNYYPILWVGAIIGVISTLLIVAAFVVKDGEKETGFERNTVSYTHLGGAVRRGGVPFLFDGNLLGNVRDSCADCNGHVRRRNKSGDDDYLGIRRPGRGGLR